MVGFNTGKKTMHEPVKGRLEDYLYGGGHYPDVEAHLRKCESCRVEVELMQSHALLLRALRAPRDLEPRAGFYAGVLNRIETQARPSAWSLFGESIFARRLAYASAAFLLLFGTFLVSSETQSDRVITTTSPEVILAGEGEHLPPIKVEPAERGAVLVNLVTYQQDFQ
jgi:hypothetical protein